MEENFFKFKYNRNLSPAQSLHPHSPHSSYSEHTDVYFLKEIAVGRCI